jgi:hypothetical protein
MYNKPLKQDAPKAARLLAAALGIIMRFPTNKLVSVCVLAGICVGAPRLSFPDDSIGSPTTAEIRRFEAKVRMPHGAGSLRKYVRYYYGVGLAEGRTIAGIYVAKAWLRPSEIPAGGIAIVAAESDILVPEDAGCEVVFVGYGRGSSSKVTASCGAELVQEP